MSLLLSSPLSLPLLSTLSNPSDAEGMSVAISVIWGRVVVFVLDCFDAAIAVEEEDGAVVVDDKGESDKEDDDVNDDDDDDDDDDAADDDAAAAAALLLFFSFNRSSASITSV